MDFWNRANLPGQFVYNTLNEQRITHFTMDGTQLILQKVFRFLTTEDLKICRLVVKSWHEKATLILMEKVQGILLHEKATDWKKFLKILTKSCSSTRLSGLAHIHPFHSFIFFGVYPDDPSWTPYKSAILDYINAKVKIPKKTVWEEKFFTTFGLQILELRYCQFNYLNTERALREFREMLSISCPNLASLTLEFQKEPTSKSTSTPTPTPSTSPSPSPQILSSGGLSTVSVFFPPNEESLKKSMDNLKKFTFCTDNKCWVNPNALEEFMSFMPALEEFTYRYTGAKKQWAFVRKVDVIDILCNLIQCGNFNKLKVLDLDSKGTVLSGEDFRKLCTLDIKNSSGSVFDNPHGKIRLTRFASQVFIKSEQDWEYFCCWLGQFNLSIKEIDIQVRSHFSQLPAEEQLPTIFPKVTTATLLLDNNFQVFLRRMPHVQRFCGVYDNELLPFCSATQSLSLDSGTGPNGSSTSSLDGSNGGNLVITNFTSNQLEVRGRKGSRKGSMKKQSSPRKSCRSKSEDFCGTTMSAAAAAALPPIAATPPPTPISQGPPPPLSPTCCTAVQNLRIYSNEESMLDIEWKAGLFRNISSLETDIYFDQDLRLIWTHLQSLTELILHLKAMVPEQAFTGAGVPPIMFQDIVGKHHAKGICTKYKESEDYHDEEHLKALNEYPNLSMMENLRVFEIHTEGRQDAFGSQFSASLIIYGVSLLYQLQRLVLPPAIPSKCLERSIPYMGRLVHLRHLTVCDDTFNNVLPFHVLKCGLPNLEIIVKYYQSEIKRMLCNPWRAERLIFPDFLPEHRSTSLSGVPTSAIVPSSSVRTKFHLSKQCSAP